MNLIEAKMILPWGEYTASPEKQEEAKTIRNRMKTEGPEELKKSVEQLQEMDCRCFCVVTNDSGVRHIFQVAKEGSANLDLVQKEYYRDYEKTPNDTFHFITGLHRAVEFMNGITEI